jgi:hypothetical protein
VTCQSPSPFLAAEQHKGGCLGGGARDINFAFAIASQLLSQTIPNDLRAIPNRFTLCVSGYNHRRSLFI